MECKYTSQSSLILIKVTKTLNLKSNLFNSSLFIRITHWLNINLIKSDISKEDISHFSETISLWLITKGPKETIKRIKLIRLLFLKHLSNQPVTSSNIISLSKSGIPKVLPLKKQIINRDKASIRAILTMINIVRWIQWWPKPDYENITKYPTFDIDQFSYVSSYIDNYLSNNKDIKLKHFKWRGYHKSESSGPNGSAYISASIERYILPSEMIHHMKVFGGDAFAKVIEATSSNNPLWTIWVNMIMFRVNRTKFSLRKISHIKSPEGKLRPIAIFDYWTQTVLKPFHDSIFETLKGITQDCTYNQDISTWIKDRYQMKNQIYKNREWYCFDLSAATDRFPIELQFNILKRYIGEEKALSWRYLMTNEEFDTPEGGTIKYNCGQPMGAYSSWAWFTLCHHILIKSIIFNNNIEDQDCYRILGDDIIIHNKVVADKYQQLITYIGIDISLEKTLISKDVNEFAKRYFYQGEEITGYQSYAIKETYTHFYELWAIFKNYTSKGWQMPSPESIHRLYKLLGIPTKLSKRLSNKILWMDTLHKMLHMEDKNYYSHRLIALSDHSSVSCCPSDNETKYLYEYLAALQMERVQQSMVNTSKEVHRFNQMYKYFDMHDNDSYHLSQLPMYKILIQDYNTVSQESMTLQDLIIQSNYDFKIIFEVATLWLPDPKRIISGRLHKKAALDNCIISTRLKQTLSRIQEDRTSEDILE